MELPYKLTIGEPYGPAMKITDPEEAKQYLDVLVNRAMRYFGRSQEEATKIEKQNLGYYAGYYDSETRRRVERLFNCTHPIFGAIAEKGEPTPEEAFEMGKKFAEKTS